MLEGETRSIASDPRLKYKLVPSSVGQAVKRHFSALNTLRAMCWLAEVTWLSKSLELLYTGV